MNVSLSGRTAVVTGGSLGIGRAIAAAFYQAGARVALIARRPEPLAEAEAAIAALAAPADARVAAWTCDVTQPDQIVATHDAIVATLGPVDILINNAGQSAGGAFETITDAAWQADLDLKLFAAIRFTRLVWPGMQAQAWGRVINLLNVYAKTPDARTAPTSVSRAAGMALTKVLANEGAADNILVNALLVGMIESGQWKRLHAADNRGISWEEWAAEQGARIPLGRIGRAEEFASLACLLCSEEGGYVTGTAINVDGGRSPVV